jgi:predicted TIM-barrel fold metal-dependent hydrolase
MRLTRSILSGKLIDCHTHAIGIDLNMMYDYLYPSTSDLIQLSTTIRNCGIDFAITFSMPTSLYFDIVTYRSSGKFISTGFGDYPFEYENKTLLAQVEKFELNNILPFVSFSLNDKVEEQVSQIEKWCNDGVIYGLKYHTMADQHYATDLQKYDNLMYVIRKYNLPILFHSGKQKFTHPNYVLAFAKNNPDIRVCVAHFGCFFNSFFEELGCFDYRNVYIDTAPLSNICVHNLKLISKGNQDIMKLNYYSPNRVLNEMFVHHKKIIWGTDFPWNCMAKLLDICNIDFSSYKNEVSILLSMKEKTRLLATDNTISFLFGE